jgi:hypothetical protein
MEKKNPALNSCPRVKSAPKNVTKLNNNAAKNRWIILGAL